MTHYLCTRYLGHSKIQTDADIKEVIRLYVYSLFLLLLLNINLHLHCGRWRQIIFPPSVSFFITIKGALMRPKEVTSP